MKQHELNQIVSIHQGLATMPDGSVIDLAKILTALNYAFQETGEAEFSEAADQITKLTGLFQGAHGDLIALEDTEGENAGQAQAIPVIAQRVADWGTSAEVNHHKNTPPPLASLSREQIEALILQFCTNTESLGEYCRLVDYDPEIGKVPEHFKPHAQLVQMVQFCMKHVPPGSPLK